LYRIDRLQDELLPPSKQDDTMEWMRSLRMALRRDPERGASLVEYAFLVVLIAMACILAVTFLGTQTSQNLSRSTSTFGEAGN
jgi:Flp pilus assembly pilin Flp